MRRQTAALAALVLFACVAPATGAAGSDPVPACIEANEDSVALRKQGHLLDARRAVAVCASPACPDVIQRVCVARMAEINRAISSVVFDVQDRAGQPVAGVKASIDGKAAEPVGTLAVELDPGAHTIRFLAPGQPPVDRTVQVLEGEKEKRLTVVVGLKPASVTTGRLVVSVDAAATVAIDGRDASVGRYDEALAAGPHDVSVTEPGKVPYRAEVEVREGETRTLSLALEDEKSKGGAVLWPWIVGGVAVAAGAAVGGYFLFKPSDQTVPLPPGKTATVQLAGWRLP